MSGLREWISRFHNSFFKYCLLTCSLFFLQYRQSERNAPYRTFLQHPHRTLHLPAAIPSCLHTNGCAGWALPLHGCHRPQWKPNVRADHTPFYGAGGLIWNCLCSYKWPIKKFPILIPWCENISSVRKKLWIPWCENISLYGRRFEYHFVRM